MHVFRKVGDKIIQFSKSIGEAVGEFDTTGLIILENMSES